MDRVDVATETHGGIMTPTQDTPDLVWRRHAARLVEYARRSLADAGLSFADDEEITTPAYYLRYEDAGATSPSRRIR